MDRTMKTSDDFKPPQFFHYAKIFYRPSNAIIDELNFKKDNALIQQLIDKIIVDQNEKVKCYFCQQNMT